MKWMMPVIGSVLGLVFSLLGGLLGRVGVFDLIGRGLFWALIMGALSFGLQVLFAQFLPEFFQQTQDEGGREDLDSMDGPSRVDITVGADVSFESEEQPQDDGPLRPLEVEDEMRDSASTQYPADSRTDREELPDLGALGSMEVEREMEVDNAPMEETLASRETVEYEGQQEDPAILARAVQTVMKREGDK